MGVPVITIFVRHGARNGAQCKYAGDEFSRRCKCPKHLRWTQNGKQYRRKAGTRSWEEAERVKRQLEIQLSGRSAEKEIQNGGRSLSEAIELFKDDKTCRASRQAHSVDTTASSIACVPTARGKVCT